VPVIQGLKKKRENLINTLVVNPDAPIDAHTADQVLEVFEQRMEDFSLAKKNKEAELQKIRATEDLMRQTDF